MRKPAPQTDWFPIILHGMAGAVGLPAAVIGVCTKYLFLSLNLWTGTGAVILLGCAVAGAGLGAAKGERLWDELGKLTGADRRAWSPLNEVNHSGESRSIAWAIAGLGGLITAIAVVQWIVAGA